MELEAVLRRGTCLMRLEKGPAGGAWLETW